MKTLVMDTCHRHLIIGCLEDDRCVSSVKEKAWKKQSELFFDALDQCMNQAGWQPDDIEQIVLTDGPGSYTGERIAMTFAKVYATQKPVEVYTLRTYLIFAGLEDVAVMMDARSNRAYCGRCKNGELLNEQIKTLDDIKEDVKHGIKVIGDCELIGQEVQEIPFIENFVKAKASWEKVENVHILTPHYLKSKEELVQ